MLISRTMTVEVVFGDAICLARLRDNGGRKVMCRDVNVIYCTYLIPHLIVPQSQDTFLGLPKALGSQVQLRLVPYR